MMIQRRKAPENQRFPIVLMSTGKKTEKRNEFNLPFIDWEHATSAPVKNVELQDSLVHATPAILLTTVSFWALALQVSQWPRTWKVCKYFIFMQDACVCVTKAQYGWFMLAREEVSGGLVYYIGDGQMIWGLNKFSNQLRIPTILHLTKAYRLRVKNPKFICIVMDYNQFTNTTKTSMRYEVCKA